MTRRSDLLSAGEIRVDAGVLRYESDEGSFVVPVAEVALIGEYTTPYGPFTCDYYLVFVTREGAVHEVSFYAEGRDAALAALNESLTAEVTPRLASSAEFNSEILWPSKFAGQSLFEFRSTAPTTLMGRLRNSVGLTRVQPRLSDGALEALLDEAHVDLDRAPARALAMTTSVLDRANDGVAQRIRGRAWKERGTALLTVGRLDEALEASERALAVFDGDPELAGERGAALLLKALVLNKLRDNESAFALVQECMQVFRARDESDRVLKALETRAMILFDMNRNEEGMETLQRARAQVEAVGDERELARIENNIGRFQLAAGNLDEATQYYERAALRFKTLEMFAARAYAWWGMARVMTKRGKTKDAIAELHIVADEFRNLGVDGDVQKVLKEIEDLQAA